MTESGTNPNRIAVAPVEDFELGDREIVSIGSQEVGVFNVDGKYHAILNTCLHQNGPLCEGKVEPEIVGEFVETGERIVQSYGDQKIVKCPWHGWEYDLETGQLLHDDEMALPIFDVTVEDEMVYLEL